MRISKVRVDKDMVLMRRTSTGGALVFDNGNGRPDKYDQTDKILPNQKRENFILSIKNQTIPKKEVLKNQMKKRKERFIYSIYRELSNLIDETLKKKKTPSINFNVLARMKPETIDRYLNHRFSNKEFSYPGGEKPFRLADLIARSIENKEYDPMEPYRKWVDWYIEEKSGKLKKSVRENKIVMGGEYSTDDKTLSPRKRALIEWETEFLNNGEIDINDLHERYNIAGLVKELREVIDRKDEKNKAVFLNKNGVLERAKQNEYHRELKKSLQQHQQQIFGSRSEPNSDARKNEKLYTYNLEVTKYIEHYFPLKKSKRETSTESAYHYLDAHNMKFTIEHQLENAVRSNLIRQGRYVVHAGEGCRFEKGVDSNVLSDQKADEAFVLNLIGNCAFAANNIRNIVDPTQTKDILGEKKMRESLDENTINYDLFRFFFGDGIEYGKITNDLFWAIRGAVTGIRNEIVHYKAGALEEIFNIQKFNNGNGKQCCYVETDFKEVLKQELANAKNAFAEQLKSGGVLTYFPVEKLTDFLTANEFSLYRSVVPFAPGFKRVMKSGIGYQTAKKDEENKKDDNKNNKNNKRKEKKEKFYDLKLKLYNTTDVKGDAWEARYFLLKTIYNNLFLPQFTNSATDFREAVNFVLTCNEKQAEGSNNCNARAFKEVRRMHDGESVVSYMSYVQSYLMLEKNKKKEKGEKEKSEIINFEKFVLQVFIKGFDSFMNSNDSFEFVLPIPSEKLITGANDQEVANRLNELEKEITKSIDLVENSINAELDAHIAFYIFCKLLNASHLNTLRNELTKYFQSQRDNREDMVNNMLHLLSIIELCLLSADSVSPKLFTHGKSADEYLKSLEPYIKEGENLKTWGGLYVQEDNETPVIHAPVELAFKYGTKDLIEGIIGSKDDFRLDKANFDEWRNLKNDIEEKLKLREKLHSEWVEAGNSGKKIPNKGRGNKKEKIKSMATIFIEKHGKKYEELCGEIDQYNWLDNKLHFVHIKNLHNLTIEILGRMAGFTALFERDLQYICNNEAVNKQHSVLETLDFGNGLPAFKGQGNEKINKEVKGNAEVYLKKIFLYDNYRQLRNFIAHFNFLTNPKEEIHFSILDMINELRKLFGYDRKLKNAVSKALIDLFDRNGMVLKFEFNKEHQLENPTVEPKKLVHLGKAKLNGKEITTNQVHTTYCDMCKALLEYKQENKETNKAENK